MVLKVTENAPEATSYNTMLKNFWGGGPPDPPSGCAYAHVVGLRPTTSLYITFATPENNSAWVHVHVCTFGAEVHVHVDAVHDKV